MRQQQINHVSQICLIYERENLQDAVDQFSKAFGITDWDGPIEIPSAGIVIYQAVQHGIEILSPIGEDNIFAEHLKTKGEGFFAMTFGVADLRAAAREAQSRGIGMEEDANGVPVVTGGTRETQPNAIWRNRFDRYEEVSLKPLCGLNFYLGQLEPL